MVKCIKKMNYEESTIKHTSKKFVCSNAHAFCHLQSLKQEDVPIEVGKKRKKKATWLFLVVNVLIVAAIFIYQFVFNETKPLSELFAEKPFYRFFFISLGIIVVYFVAAGIGYSILLKRATGRFRFWLGLQLAIVGKYWDNITPFGSGGQFAQIAYAKKYDVLTDKSTGIIVGKYMTSMIAFTLIGVVALCLPISTFTTGIVIKILAAIGVAINLLITCFVWIVSINKKMCSVIVVGGLKLLHKMHIVKNYQKALYKTLRFIRQYQKSFRYYLKNPFIFIAEVFIALVENICIALIAYMVYLAFNPDGTVSVVSVLTMSFLCSFATSYIPLPGGSGMAEFSFGAMFAKLFSGSSVFWALIFWRLLTYYVVVLIGFVFTLFEPMVHKSIQKKKQLKN